MVPAAGTPSRFYSLDALRGAAALSVVFWHWQHFFYRDGIILPLDRKTQPLYRAACVLYESGWLAVDMFFTLSGFIFFWLYASAVRSRRVDPWEFFVLRFSRLYPLHLVTLLLVTAGLAAFHSVGIAAFTYPANDVYHFILQLFLASNWGFERGMSFNAPIWSVSIEVLLYAVFFVFCRYWRHPLPGVVVLIALGFGLSCFTPFWLQGRGVFSFFIGGLSFLVYRRLSVSASARLFTVLISVLAVAGWIAIVLGHVWRPGFLLPFVATVSWHQVESKGLASLANHLPRLLITGLVFPLSLIALSLLETRRPPLGRRLAPLGDISYSSYLLHFPLEMLFYAAASAMGVAATFFYSDTSLVLFMCALVVLSFATHRWLEVPAQRRLRKRFLHDMAVPGASIGGS